VGELSAQGIGVVYISHRLEEIERLADRVVVLRDGRIVYDEPRGLHNRGAIISAMAGRDVGEHIQKANSVKAGEFQLLEARNLCRGSLIHGVNLSLHRGELVALTGLVGSGRTELLRLLAGIDQTDQGQIFYEGTPFQSHGPAHSIRQGIAFLPEDRKDQGLFLYHSAQTNLSISVLEALSGGLGLLRHVRSRDEARLFEDKSDLLGLQPKNPNLAAGRFSGGNQQKILLGRILATRPRLLLLDEPTRGVDASARQDIYRILAEAAAKGTAVLFATSEFAEALTLGQRIVVMREGTIAADFPNSPDLSPNEIMRHAVSEQS
jgi:ABC-type sugar transport system ATPase subunit